MERKKTALELFRSSHNCSQSVFAAFADKDSIDQETAKAVAAGFGAGMGRRQATCGAVTGAVMAIGLAGFDPADMAGSKLGVYEKTRRFIDEFERRMGGVSCRSLLGVDLNTPEGVAEAKQKNLFGFAVHW